MKTKTFSLIVVLLLASNIYSQQENLKEESSEDLWALQFQIASNFTLTTFGGSTLSLKRKLSDCTSLRFGLGINSAIFDSDIEVYPTPSNGINRGTNNNETKFGLDISALYLWNTENKNNISAYYGLGPLVGFSYSKTKTENFTVFADTRVNVWQTTTINSLAIGSIGVLGVEWFVKENISLVGEYGAALTYNYSSEKRIDDTSDHRGSTTENNVDNFRLYSLGAKLGIAIYF